ncbi:MAG: chorion class high-cysteine HCB protein 13 [Eubacteriales bacterium]|nr:chorion class high-cysteine HCB protein 13 [Eubacteriales bacterium]
MSDLAATNCGGCNDCGGCNSGGLFSNGCNNSCIWIILLLLFCGGGSTFGSNGCGCGNNGCNSCTILILLLLFCGDGFGCGCN